MVHIRRSKWLICLAGFLALLGSVASGSTLTLDSNGAQDVSNLQQIALAIHNYLDVNNAFPPEYISSGGTPLLSWRVAILPYLGESALYSQFDLTKSWDDPVNMALLGQMPDVYRSPTDAAGSTVTRYVAGSGAGTMFEGTNGVLLSSITDGTSNTILLGETEATSIAWTAPTDIPIGNCPMLNGTGFSSIVPGAVPFAFADGSVGFLPNGIDCNTLKGFFLRNDGVINPSARIPYEISATVPEPATFALLFSGVVGVMARKRRRSS